MTGDGDPALKGRRVLVVEDQYLLADEMGRMIAGLGGTVIGPVAKSDAAVHLLHSVAVDFAVLDINLGDGQAYPVAEELIRRRVPFVFATGYEAFLIPDAYRDVPRLDKPLTPKTLADAVWRLGL